MLFSQRKGLKIAQKLLQIDDVDSELRYGLWNALLVCIWDKYNPSTIHSTISSSNLETLFYHYWHSYFKYPLDNLPEKFRDRLKHVRDYFLKCDWNEVYDFIEFTAQKAPNVLTDSFCIFCNRVLQRENSAYRIVNSKIVEISSEDEVQNIEEAIRASSPFPAVRTHLTTALSLLADRKNPDYRNSIKESISAIESLAKILSGNQKTTLGDALKIFESEGRLHPAFKKSLSSLYGYTSDANGIRHSLLEESTLTFSDAKFMFVACTAFVNYLIGKAAEVGIKIKKS